MDGSDYVLRGDDPDSNSVSYHGSDIYHNNISHNISVYYGSSSYSTSVFHDHTISPHGGGGHGDGDYPQVPQRPEGGSNGDSVVAADR